MPTEVLSKASAACGATNKCGMTESGGRKPSARRKIVVSRLIVARFEYAEQPICIKRWVLNGGICNPAKQNEYNLEV